MESSVLHFQIQHADEAGEGEGQEEVQTGSSYHRSRNAKGMPICQANGLGQGQAYSDKVQVTYWSKYQKFDMELWLNF